MKISGLKLVLARCPAFFLKTLHVCVQPNKIARGLKFWIWTVEGLGFICNENKDTDLLPGYLICAFVFAYAKSWFSHDAAHIRKI